MSDWSLYEVNEYVAPCDAHKRPHHVANVGKTLDTEGSATETVLQRKDETYLRPSMKDGSSTILEGSHSLASENVVAASCDFGFIASASALASQDARISNECFSDCNIDTESNISCSKNPISGSRVSTDGCRNCYVSVNDVPPPVTNHDYLDNEKKDGENDLMYYDLPDIDNFEDIDRLFRNCDAKFGQGHMGTADELSWFSSSSNTIYGSEVTFGSGLQSSCSEFRPLNNTPGHHGADTNFLPKSDQPMADHGKRSSLYYQSYADWLDIGAQNKGESATKEQINMQLKQMESQCSSEEKRIQQDADQKLFPSVFSTQPYSSQHFSEQKHFLGSASSSYMNNVNPCAQMEYDHPKHQIPFTRTTSRIKFENETNPSSSYNVSDNIMCLDSQCMERFPEPPTMTFKKKHHGYQHEIGANSEVENIGLEPAVEIDSSVVYESSCMTSVYPDDISLEATSFWQLQHVMDQLDIRTRLCIRDSLYRLAGSAKQRNGFTNTENCSTVSKDASGTQSSEAPNKCAEFMDAETVTNPIDRSIAHLLFTGLPEPATRSI